MDAPQSHTLLMMTKERGAVTKMVCCLSATVMWRLRSHLEETLGVALSSKQAASLGESDKITKRHKTCSHWRPDTNFAFKKKKKCNHCWGKYIDTKYIFSTVAVLGHFQR